MTEDPPVEEPPLMELIAAGIAHEVRNPLNALQINVRILDQELAELVPDRNARPYVILSKISHELASLDDFVTEFLRFARPPHLRLAPVPLKALLSDLFSFIAPELARKGVGFEIRFDTRKVVVQADTFQLKHALLNLVLNALQATPAGGSIAIEVGRQGAMASIAVVDTGEGIAPDKLERVFDLFFTMREGGTGLGLPMARRIVEQHGGILTLESEMGRGTVARVRLPVFEEA